MAYDIPGDVLSYEAAADLSTKLFTGVKLDSNGQVVSCGANDGDFVGVLRNKPAAAGQAASVMVEGVSKAVAGGSISINTKVTTKSDGTFVAATSGQRVVGRAETAAASGELFSLRIMPNSTGAVTVA